MRGCVVKANGWGSDGRGWNRTLVVRQVCRALGLLRRLLLGLLGLVLLPVAGWAQLPQTIYFASPTPAAFAGTAVVLTGAATSGLPVTFSVVSGPAQVSGVNGSTLTYTGVGSVVVQADQAGGNGYSPAPSVQAPAVNVLLLTQPVERQSPSVQTVVTFTAQGTLARMSALTQGAANQDFSLPSGTASPPDSICRVGVAYAAGQTCVLTLYFRPMRPGIRYGGLTLTDAAGTLLANSYIYGYGVGPQVVYAPIVQTLVGNSLGAPSGVAINGQGDLFVSNQVGSGLTEIAANGTVTPIGNFTLGKDVAVDGSGNVFLITADTLYEVQAVNGVVPLSPGIRTLATGFTVSGGGLAIDGGGNAYVADSPAGSSTATPTGVVYVVYAVDGVIPSLSAKQTIGPAFASPTGVAVDSSGNVYLSDGRAPGIFEMLAVNGRVPPSPVVLSLGSGFVAPSNIRLDNTNDIYISDSGLPGILEFPAVNGVVSAQTTPKSLGSGFSFPQGLLVDGADNVYVADQGFSQVVKLNYSSVPTLNFADTRVGQTSPDSPQAVTYTNAGNADLVFAAPASGANPAITSGFALGANSTCPQVAPGGATATLPIGQSCTDQVSFTPQSAGAQSGTLTTTDNDLSVANATQVVQLHGNGIVTTPNLVFSIADHFVDDPPFGVAATADSPGALSYAVLSGPATLAGTTVTLTGTGVVSVQVTQAASGSFGPGTQVARFTVSKHPQTIAFLQPRSPFRLGAGTLPLVATASSGLPVSFSILSGPATVSGSVVTFTGAGTVVIAADQAGNQTIAAAAEVTRTVIVSAVAVALTAAPNPVFLGNPVTLTASLTAVGGVPTGSVTFVDGLSPLAIVPLNGAAASFSLSTLALGSHAVTAVYSGDGNFPATTSPVVTVVVQDFALTLAKPDVTIFHGGTATYSLLLGPVGGAATAGSVNFSVTGTPDRSTLTFSPQTVAAGSGQTAVTLTVATPNYPVGPFASSVPGMQLRPVALAFGLLVLPLGWRRMRRTRQFRPADVLLALAGLMLATSLLSGCGSGWRTQRYSLTISATSGNLQRTVAASLTTECRDGRSACPIE